MKNESYTTKELVTIHRVLQPFEGSNIGLMQRLLTGRENGIKVDFTRLPLTTKQLAEARLGRLDLGVNGIIGTDDQTYLRSVYVNTSTAVLPNPSVNDVKLDRNCSLIYGLTPETKIEAGNLLITQDQYDASTGFRLTAEQVNELRNNSYALPNVRRDFWEEQLEGDVELTEDYILDVEKRTGYNFDESAMGLWLSSNKGMRLLCVSNVGDGGRSGAYGRDVLASGRLVGYVAEPQLVAKKTGIPLEKLV